MFSKKNFLVCCTNLKIEPKDSKNAFYCFYTHGEWVLAEILASATMVALTASFLKRQENRFQ